MPGGGQVSSNPMPGAGPGQVSSNLMPRGGSGSRPHSSMDGNRVPPLTEVLYLFFCFFDRVGKDKDVIFII